MPVQIGNWRSPSTLGPRNLAIQMGLRLDLRKVERHRFRIAKLRQVIDPGTSRIPKPQQLRHLVKSLARGIVQRPSNQPVIPRPNFRTTNRRPRQKQMRVPTGNHKSQRRHRQTILFRLGTIPMPHPRVVVFPAGVGYSLLPILQQDSMNMSFKMIHRNQRNFPRKGYRLGIGNTHEQSPSQSRPTGHSDSVKIGQTTPSLSQRSTRNRDNIAQVLAAGQLRHNPAVRRMRRDLRGDN